MGTNFLFAGIHHQVTFITLPPQTTPITYHLHIININLIYFLFIIHHPYSRSVILHNYYNPYGFHKYLFHYHPLNINIVHSPNIIPKLNIINLSHQNTKSNIIIYIINNSISSKHIYNHNHPHITTHTLKLPILETRNPIHTKTHTSLLPQGIGEDISFLSFQWCLTTPIPNSKP